MEKHVTKLFKGIATDNGPLDQPPGSVRFCLNGMSRSREGDNTMRSNEESNESCSFLAPGYIPIGKCYIGEGDFAILSTNPSEGLDEIGILKRDCKYEIHVTTDLSFEVTHQIDVTYRLRRGCERVIYFTDFLNRPRYYNFDKPKDFQDLIGNWSPDKFDLIRRFKNTPNFEDISIDQDGGLLPGSYNFSIAYLDGDFNQSEWIISTDTIIIYNDNPNSLPFHAIRGSTNVVSNHRNYGRTNKSIKLQLSNLDTDYPFYRIAIIEATNGSSTPSSAKYTQPIPTGVRSFTYTGENVAGLTVVEDIQNFANIIEAAKNIDQLEDRLIFSNTKGPQINFCKLQKYASKIVANAVFETIVLNDVKVLNNPKRGTVHFEKIGYMPGEIYSFGLVYVFDDYSLSPVFHIPGKAPLAPTNMSSENILLDTFYTETGDCGGLGYWGIDSQGQPLIGTRVRHHRFPLRSEVDKPLFTVDGDTSTVPLNTLYLNITGEIDLVAVTEPTITYVVNYTINAAPFQVTLNIDVASYDPDQGILNVFVAQSLDEIIFVSVEELVPPGATPTDPSLYSTLTYTPYISANPLEIDDQIYRSEIFGITFSNIEMPSLEDTGGKKVLGYYTVRNERTEGEKTILDNGILTPLLVEERAGVEKFVAHGHLMPIGATLKTDVFGLIHPEHKFFGKEYGDVTDYIKEGEYTRTGFNFTNEITQDVQPGTSYDSSVNKRRERDTDGFDLHIFARYNKVTYTRVEEVLATDAEIKSTFYLDALFSKPVKDSNDITKDVYNLSSDNKIGIVSLDKELDVTDLGTKLPYVVMKRDLGNPYSTFRSLPYYLEHENIQYFTSSSVTLFNGDSYISPIRYTSSMFYDLRLRKRSSKKGILNFVIGIYAAIAGAVLVAVGIVPAGLALIGLGVTQIATGIRKNQMAKVYQDLYEQGLKDTVQDAQTNVIFSPNPPDDEIQWFSDSLSGVWIESGVNMNWRMGNTIGLTDFMDAPTVYDKSELDTYLLEKLTIVDPAADGGRLYQGFAKAELYDINLDYIRRNKEKIFYHLPIEYDCCSKCIEEFPHRRMYSEVSFQEELTDNFRVFLPNNYKDLEGETGSIINMFRIQNNLYLHTEEAIWHQLANIQERVTGDIISFIGTGDFLSLPPRKIVDGANGMSAGTAHKWGSLKTPYGVFFVSEKQNTIYRFDGNNLSPISRDGEFTWFKNNIIVRQDKDYYEVNQIPFPFKDNPSNPYGTGYLWTYDSQYERVIVTKKDFLFDNPGSEILGENYLLCIGPNGLEVFPNFMQTIEDMTLDGYTYVGLEDCKMKFEKVAYEEQEIEQTLLIPNEADIHVFLDTSGSFGSLGDPCLDSITDAVDAWLIDFQASNPDWIGTLYYYEDSTERWLAYAENIAALTYPGQDLSTKDIIVVSFINEADSIYHDATLDNPIGNFTTEFSDDYNSFISYHAQYKSFIGILYPIVFGDTAGTCGIGGGGSLPASKNFLLHSIAALWGVPMTPADITSELPNPNPGFTPAEWTTLLTALQGANPYPDTSLRSYGWTGKWDRAAADDGTVITPSIFSKDIQDLLQAQQLTEFVTVEVPFIDTLFVQGTPVLNIKTLNASWTKSFSLEDNTWISYHSYLPNFYLHSPDKFYSYVLGNNNIWQHNILGKYGSFYGQKHPFVLEFVSLSNPIINKIYDALKIQTQCKEYVPAIEQFRDVRLRTFDKLVAYNTHQCTGLLTLRVKDSSLVDEDYLLEQLDGSDPSIATIDHQERDWTINSLRDIRIDYDQAIWKADLGSLSGEYFIDKVLNDASLSFDKDWTELQPLRDKYLIVRLIFDNFDDLNLIMNYSIEDEIQSER